MQLLINWLFNFKIFESWKLKTKLTVILSDFKFGGFDGLKLVGFEKKIQTIKNMLKSLKIYETIELKFKVGTLINFM